MRYFLPKSLKTKLIIALFAIGFLPYLFIMFYSLNLGQQKIIESITSTQYVQMSKVKERVEEQLVSLRKEMLFLSGLDLMNDMIVNDIDKRISQLLIQKQEDLGLQMQLFTIRHDTKIIASSSRQDTALFFDQMVQLKSAIGRGEGYFFTAESIVIFVPIESDLSPDRVLGYLLAEYAFSNLNRFNIHHEGVRSIIYHPATALQVGTVYEEPLHLTGIRGDYLSEDTMILYEALDGMLEEWYVVYMIKKSIALAFLNEFLFFLAAMFFVGFVVIAAVSFWVSKRILGPIASLSDAAKEIVATKNYTTRVQIDTDDEISELARAFNTMVHQTHDAFEVLEAENHLRLKRFIQLINIFNRLIQAQSEDECIQIALDELQMLVPEQHFSFSTQTQEDDTTSITLYIKDFEKGTQEFYGVILLAPDNTTDLYEEKFYRSVGTMIMLQLNQIRLIKRTEEVSHAKSTFISHMSHELRTPLHAILSFSQYLITYENLNEDQQSTIGNIENSAQHLLSMINDILDLVQIEAGKTAVSIDELNSDEIETIPLEIIAMLEVLAEQKNINITLQNTLPANSKVYADSQLLKQVIINLLSNAIKFTDRGSIDFLIEERGDHICITIKDTGIGISEADISSLFEDFIQADNQGENPQKGSGLGLSISQRLAHLFEADIELSSEGKGKGSTATIYLKKM